MNNCVGCGGEITSDGNLPFICGGCVKKEIREIASVEAEELAQIRSRAAATCGHCGGYSTSLLGSIVRKLGDPRSGDKDVVIEYVLAVGDKPGVIVSRTPWQCEPGEELEFWELGTFEMVCG